MALLHQINGELVESMKARDEIKTSTLRLVIAAVNNKRIELGHELSDEEILDVLAKEGKKRRESIEAYKVGNRQDLVDREEKEFEVLGKYLPEQMNEGDIAKVVDDVIGEVGVNGNADFGKVIGSVMAKLKGKADGSVVSSIVKAKLNG